MGLTSGKTGELWAVPSKFVTLIRALAVGKDMKVAGGGREIKSAVKTRFDRMTNGNVGL